jgi:hypothetical protein
MELEPISIAANVGIVVVSSPAIVTPGSSRMREESSSGTSDGEIALQPQYNAGVTAGSIQVLGRICTGTRFVHPP